MWRRLSPDRERAAGRAARSARPHILIGPPLLQLFLFSYAATLEVTNIDIGVVNRDAGRWSTEVMQRIAGAPTFRSIVPMSRLEQAREAIDNRRVIAALSFDQDFSRDIAAGRRPDPGHSRRPALECVADRARLSDRIVNSVSQSIALNAETRSSDDGARRAALVQQNLIYMWFTVPSLSARSAS